MSDTLLFISHASADDEFVAELRKTLEAQRLPVWVDSRNLRGGSKLAPEQALDKLALEPDTPPLVKGLILRLQAILAGDRNPALAADPKLNYGSAAELQLLLEALPPR